MPERPEPHAEPEIPASRAASWPAGPDVHFDPGVVGHEESDVSIRAVALFGGGLVAVLLLVGAVVWAAFGYLAAREQRQDPPRPPMALDAGQPPPEPRLQTTPRADLARFRTRELEELTSYDWVDRTAGLVRLPIEVAMDRLVRDGLPPPVMPIAPPPSVPPADEGAGAVP